MATLRLCILLTESAHMFPVVACVIVDAIAASKERTTVNQLALFKQRVLYIPQKTQRDKERLNSRGTIPRERVADHLCTCASFIDGGKPLGVVQRSAALFDDSVPLSLYWDSFVAGAPPPLAFELCKAVNRCQHSNGERGRMRALVLIGKTFCRAHLTCCA